MGVAHGDARSSDSVMASSRATPRWNPSLQRKRANIDKRQMVDGDRSGAAASGSLRGTDSPTESVRSSLPSKARIASFIDIAVKTKDLSKLLRLENESKQTVLKELFDVCRPSVDLLLD